MTRRLEKRDPELLHRELEQTKARLAGHLEAASYRRSHLGAGFRRAVARRTGQAASAARRAIGERVQELRARFGGWNFRARPD